MNPMELAQWAFAAMAWLVVVGLAGALGIGAMALWLALQDARDEQREMWARMEERRAVKQAAKPEAKP